MKILHTADWHIGQFKGPVVDGVNLRSQDTVKCLEYMVQVAIEEKPDIVCVSGNIFHQEQVGPVRYSDEMITATNIITSLAHFSKYVIVMRGTPNHDGAAQFRVLERMLLNIRNVDVVTEPGVIKTPYDTLDKLKQGQNIFVGAMADIFGEWIPDSWIEDVLYACAKHPQHNYLFLTKNPKRYTQYGVPSGKGNMWYGTTVTNSEDMERIYQLPSLLNTFASIEPLLEDIDENISALKYLNWIIIGAETGHRKEKVIPEFEWIKRIVVEADYNGIPVFMKDSLIPIVGEKNMRRDYPKELQIRKRSEKVNKKLSGNCMLCGKTEDKNKMVTLTARAVRGGRAASFGHMCHSCFAKWLTSHNIPVPDLENKKEIEDGKEKL